MSYETFYEFGATSFRRYVWLKGGGPFKNPRAMDVEMANPGAYGVEVWDLAGNLAGKAHRKNARGGWASFNFKASWDMPPIPDGITKSD